MTNPWTAWRLILLALAVAVWLVCFALLVRLGTWAAFPLAGTALVVLAFKFDPALPVLLRPSVGKLGLGVLLGAVMILLTHVLYAAVALRLPEIKTATLALYSLLNGSGFHPAVQAAFVMVVASCEEILFRGTVAGSGHVAGRVGRIAILALCYAAATMTLGSFLLAACALFCGFAWGGLRVATRSLVPPIAAHIVWDLGIFLAWPLV